MIRVILIALLLLPSLAWGACTGSSPTWTSTPDRDAVAACVAGATSGDIINVTAGDGTETWATPISITTPVKLIGPGKTSLVITYATTSNAITATDKDGIRISGFGFHAPDTNSATIGIQFNGCTNFSVDNNDFTSEATNANTTIASFNASVTNPVTTGVFYNNTVKDGKVHCTNGGGTQAMWSSLWTNALDLGGASAVYVEDNYFENTPGNSNNCVDTNRGSRSVVRYNTIINSYIMAHGFQGIGRGSRKWEIYGNDMTDGVGGDSTWNAAVFQRAGTGVIFYNSIIDYAVGIRLTDDRSIYDDTLRPNSDNTTAGGKCDGDNRTDGNTDPNPVSGHKDGWPCRDQIGRSTDAASWTDVEGEAGPAQASAPAYLWANRTASALATVDIPADSNVNFDSSVTGLTVVHIVADRDFLTQGASFDGTSGVGCGTLAARPATCTAGRAYWATDQSCTDISTHVGSGGSKTKISGTLYICGSSNWTDATTYTPYTYPHPLRGEGGSGGSGHSFSGGASHSFGSGSTITWQ